MRTAKRYSREEKDLIKSLYKSHTASEISKIIGRSKPAIQTYIMRMGWQKGYNPMKLRLSREDKLWLRLNYPHMSNDLCTMKFGCSARTVQKYALEMKLSKTDEFMKRCREISIKKAQDSNSIKLKGYFSPALQMGREIMLRNRELRKIKKNGTILFNEDPLSENRR